METYKKLNILTGWFAFAVATLTYVLTLEPTASFWDCGEFITSAFKLEVGHPPGAPLFMLVGRFFSLFAFGDVTKVAFAVNLMSALASSFTILFLFWTITHIAKKIVSKNETPTLAQSIAILGSGLIGALTYTFSDSFWFSAVEGEVYASSSLFTAVVFWAILKWENEADEPYANRWLILIAYLMGLSIGVHLLNLLTIPAIVFVYYFRKYKPSQKGVVYTAVISLAVLIAVQYGIIHGVVVIGSWFELLFVNSFGLPFNTGVFVYLALLVGGLTFGIYYTFTQGKVVLNTILTAFAVILIGYSSFALIVIRSNANTPMDQNNPDDFFALLSYLNREQYGDRPLGYGQYFNAEVTGYQDGKPFYVPQGDKYVVIDKKVIREFDPAYTTIFPRMYSDQQSPNHLEGYPRWIGKSQSDFFENQLNANGQAVTDRFGDPVYDYSKPRRSPTFAENLHFFWKYQIRYMYMRYFMWNFVGRQNDIQGNGEAAYGNWVSGIGFIDALHVGSSADYPDVLAENKGHNTYFFLPLILGLLGMFYMVMQFIRKQNPDFWVVLMFFVMTGLAIVVYLNQPPYQPRERDYAYAGSFYVFAIYVGIGVLAMWEYMKTLMSSTIAASLATVIAFLLVPFNMGAQNWDDHDRSDRYTARDFGANYLNSCAPNAILFTNGDNDTFPLWYAQEVEGIRTDVRVINLSYLNTDWYIEQMQQRAYQSAPVPFMMTYDKYIQGKRDIVYVQENPNYFFDEKYEAHKAEFAPMLKALHAALVETLTGSEFPSMHSADFETLKKDAEAVGTRKFIALVNNLAKDEAIAKYKLDKNILQQLKSNTDQFARMILQSSVDIRKIIDFIASDDPENKLAPRPGTLVDYTPTNKFVIPVDKQVVLNNGTVPAQDADKVVDAIEWNFPRGHIRKNELMVMDLIAHNNWERPIYFAITIGGDGYMGLENYFRLEGMAYRLVPVKNTTNDGGVGSINTDILYDKLMNEFAWGGIDTQAEDIYLDENNQRMIMNFRNNFYRLANTLAAEGEADKAMEVLDKCATLFPHSVVAYNYYNYLQAQVYTDLKAYEKSQEILDLLTNVSFQDLVYFQSLPSEQQKLQEADIQRTTAILHNVGDLARTNAAYIARAKQASGNTADALLVLNNCMQTYPNNVSEFGNSAIEMAKVYFELQTPDKAVELLRQTSENTLGTLVYYVQNGGNNIASIRPQIEAMKQTARVIGQLAEEHEVFDLANEIQTTLSQVEAFK